MKYLVYFQTFAPITLDYDVLYNMRTIPLNIRRKGVGGSSKSHKRKERAYRKIT